MSGVRMAASWEAELARESHGRRLAAMRHAEGVSKRLCPIDTGALESTITGEADEASMACRLSAGNEEIDYAATVELGGRPHDIRSKGAYPLRSRETGQVFGPLVHHPGTPAQPYLRPGAMSIGGFNG